MDNLEDTTSEIIEINGQKYLVPTVITANGRTVLDYDGKIKIPLPIDIANMRFTKVSTEINNRQKPSFKQRLVSFITLGALQ
jgi:hypothetical protein